MRRIAFTGKAPPGIPDGATLCEDTSFDLSSPPAEAGAVLPPRLLCGASIGVDPGGCGVVVQRFFAESQQPRDGLQRHEQDDRAKEHF